MASINNIQWSYKVNAPRPLDASSVFTSLKDAQDAAKTAFYSGTEVASSAGIPYFIGQILTVVTAEGVALYQIQAGEKDAKGYVRGSADLKMVGTGANDEEIKALAERVTALEGKEDKDTLYTGGDGIDISADNVVSLSESAKYDDTAVWGEINAIGDKVFALETREDKDTTYTAGNGINISESNEISVDASSLDIPSTYDDTELRGLIGGNTESISSLTEKVTALEGKEDKDTTYTAGNGIDITEGVISIKEGVIGSGYDDTAIKKRISDLEAKEDKDTTYTAGDGIDIKDGVISVKEGVIGEGYDDTDVRNLISANTGNITSLSSKVDALEQKPDKDTTYTAGKGVSISEANEISVNVSDLELPETYDDSALKARIKALEDEPDKDTVYDDTDVKKRLSDLEAKTDKDTTYSAGTAISISATNEISVDRDALNIPDITENTNAIAGHTTDIANLQKAVTEQTDLIAKYEATLDWIINEYDPSIESEVDNG